MPNRTLALALAGLMAAPCGQAEESKWPSPRLEQRAAERGPIRTQVEAALSAHASVLTVQEAEAARRPGPPSPPTGFRIPVIAWILIGLGSLLVAWHEWAQGWSKM